MVANMAFQSMHSFALCIVQFVDVYLFGLGFGSANNLSNFLLVHL